MNVTSEMYHIKPIFELDQKIPLPKCMYSMKNLHVQNGLDSNKKESKTSLKILEQEPLPEVAMLESQQEEILKKLALLKEQIERFRGQLNQPLSKPTTSAAHCPPAGSFTQEVQDLVVYASPSSPPYSLLALRELWGVSVSISSHAHSSLTGPVPQKIVQAFEQRQQPGQLHITLVWKQVGQHPRLVLSPTSHAELQGEVTILRLLSRLGPSPLDSLSAEKASAADWALDLIFQLAEASAPKRELAASLQRLVAGSAGWLMDSRHPTLVDAALWSYLKGEKTMECPVKLTNWMKNCDKLFL